MFIREIMVLSQVKTVFLLLQTHRLVILLQRDMEVEDQELMLMQVRVVLV